MTDKSQALIDELVAAAIAFGRGQLPDWQTRIEVARVALREYIEGLEPRWIPVSERLPELYETVFVVIYDGFENNSEVARLTYLGNGNWWSWESERYVVTHWTPLPEPPEVQE